MKDSSAGRRIVIRGTVQGIGFRPWVYRLAMQQAVRGRVFNDASGVIIEAFGRKPALDAFLHDLQSGTLPNTRIAHVSWEAIPDEPIATFTIVESSADGERHVSIPADLATCDACLAEIFDPGDRRYRYPFTNCTGCGPRFTIARDVPYDRASTSMAGFRMCEACQREYDHPGDRRFHAQPNACPACGPRLRAVGPDGLERHVADAIRAAGATLRAGGIVAVKGLGGFHLACDASSAEAVRRLRRRKRREEKPLAVMVRDAAAAETLAALNRAALALLRSPERPIVLAWRIGRTLPDDIAPGSSLLGLLLPYTPLHHLLLADCERPLVMTSGNVTDEPIAYRNEEALERLSGIADLCLLHDRDIVSRCDDSVATVMTGGPVVLRRSRGYVPQPVRLARPVAAPVLGTGALLKNTFCLAAGREAWLGPHIGDLENLETFDEFREGVERMTRFLGIEPAVVAHDLHPEYLTTQYARGLAGITAVAVQHHHAHVASAMAEHGLEGPVLGVAFDGTGYGTDGTAWGGEVLLADYGRAERLATCRPIPLAGGDAAIRQPWRVALALLDDAFEGDPPLDALPLFERVPAREIATVRQLIAAGVNAPLARGMGRVFDAFGALVLARRTVSFEGQLALAFNMAAAPAERGSYRYEIAREGDLAVLDLRQAVREATFEVIGHAPVEAISARFHNTLTAAAADLVRSAARRHGRLPVVLTGGCFQNVRLTESLAAELSPRFRVWIHRDVPPGDGGIALGQAAVAGLGG
jgi:hydrogenase maturation protein HypF